SFEPKWGGNGPMPVSQEEYDDLIAQFERDYTLGMIGTCICFFAGVGLGFYSWFSTNELMALVTSIGAGMLLGFRAAFILQGRALKRLNKKYRDWSKATVPSGSG
ncbi:MAG: hypothetical protein AAFQ13_12715, partial [Pseudomonadota bacterium]